MSYNGYNGYSPYFNQQRASDGRSQFTYQYAANQHPYQRPYSEANGQQQPQSLAQSTSVNAYKDPTRYSGVENAGTGAYNDSRADYSYAEARSPENTTALGNLAYASSLRRDRNGANQERESLQKVADYDRATATTNHPDYQRSDSRGAGVNYPNYPPASTSERYDQYQNYGVQHYSQPVIQTQNNTYKPPSRPSSGQNISARSQANATSAQPPRVTSASGYRSPTSHQTQTQSSNTQQSRHPSSTNHNGSSQAGTYDRQRRISQSQEHTAQPTSSRIDRSDSIHEQVHANVDRSDGDRLPSVNGSAKVQGQPEKAPLNPTTIDPNKVFNQYEYQKRQEAIAAEAKAAKEKAALEAEAQRKQAEQRVATVAQGSALSQDNDDSSMKTQMEAEMKLMLEKMRDYKSKDPTLFSQIWEQVKKAQPPSSTKDALPASKEVAVAVTSASPRGSIASPRVNGTPHLPSLATVESDPTHPDPNAQLVTREFVSSASRPLAPAIEEVDRGKYPAARRRGKLYKARVSLEQSDEVPENSASKSPKSHIRQDAVAAVLGPPTGYVRATDEDIDSNRSIQRVWVSGKRDLSRQSMGAIQNQGLTDGLTDDPVPQTNDMVPPMNASAASPPVPAPKPPPRPAGQTYWPEEDKWALAIAARDTLLSHPANGGKNIKSEEIRSLLDQGPSYEELCGILENKGFVVERTPFAQQLLAAVPRLKQQRPEATTQMSTTALAPAPAPAAQATERAQDRSSHVWRGNDREQGVIAPVAHMYDGPVTTATKPKEARKNGNLARRQEAGRVASSKKTSSASKQEAHPSVPQPPPTQPAFTKQESAKKRNFSEIVDLTAEMDSDEELERQRVEKIRKLERIKSRQTEIPESDDQNNMDRLKKHDRPTTDSRSSPPSGAQSSAIQSDEDVTGISRFKHITSPQRERLRKAHVIEPINRNNALRRSTYDSGTIARDILIAAGKHPAMPPLNYHLEGLKTNFRYVENSSDLSTFKWDLVDPGGPTPMFENQTEEKVVQDVSDEPVAASQPIARLGARIALPGTGNREDSAMVIEDGPVKSQGVVSKQRSLPSSSKFMQSRPSSGQPQAPHRRVSHANHDVSMLGAEESSFIAKTLKRSDAHRDAATSQSPALNKSRFVIESRKGSSEVRRKGRPAEPKKKDQCNSISHQSQSSPGIPENAAGPMRAYTNIASNVGLRSPFTATMNPAPSTPARPSGLRNEVMISPAAGFAVVIPSPRRTDQRSRPENEGSPNKSQIGKASLTAPIPKRQAYTCRWRACQAKLHNLETLRKHVHNHRKEFDEESDYQCLWTGCGKSRIIASDTNAEREPLEFKSETSWERHMDGRHLDHYAWELGDGPSPHPSGHI